MGRSYHAAAERSGDRRLTLASRWPDHQPAELRLHDLFHMRDLTTETTSHGVIVLLGFSYTKLSRLFGR